jgi:hypothetical protein
MARKIKAKYLSGLFYFQPVKFALGDYLTRLAVSRVEAVEFSENRRFTLRHLEGACTEALRRCLP